MKTTRQRNGVWAPPSPSHDKTGTGKKNKKEGGNFFEIFGIYSESMEVERINSGGLDDRIVL